MLMQRDAPNWMDPDEDVVSVHDDSQSDIEMVSAHEPDQHTNDSSPDSGTEDSHNPSDDSDMESNQDRVSRHHSDSSSAHCSNLSLDPGSDASLGRRSRSDPYSSDENELVHKFWEEEEEQERQCRSKKPKRKDSSHQKETSAGPYSSEKEERCKKRKKREKEAKAHKAREAKLQAEERKEKEEDKRVAWEKLINQLWREKYLHECPELANYQKNNIMAEHRESINLDDHTAYLQDIQKDKSLFPYKNVMSGPRLIEPAGRTWSEGEGRQGLGSD